MMKGIINSIRSLNGKDISNLVYPLAIFFTGWYIISNITRLVGEWNYDLIMLVYTLFWGLIPVAFLYSWNKKVKLRFSWSLFSII